MNILTLSHSGDPLNKLSIDSPKSGSNIWIIKSSSHSGTTQVIQTIEKEANKNLAIALPFTKTEISADDWSTGARWVCT